MKINKETKIFIGVMLVLIGGAIIIGAYAKKKLLKETFESYDNGETGIEITSNNSNKL